MVDRILERAEKALDQIADFQTKAGFASDPKAAADWTLAAKNSASAIHSLVQAARCAPQGEPDRPRRRHTA